MKPTVLFIFGTRPEAIKTIPLIKEMEKHPHLSVKICITAQHRELLDQVLDFFSIQADYDLNIMKPNQNLFDSTQNILGGIKKIIDQVKPNLIIVQGDTTTAFVGALSGYYTQTPVAHLEAGLRTHQKYEPFPEEINRQLIAPIADFHFCPTKKAQENLAQENIYKNVFTTGNTVIDALFLGKSILEQSNYIPEKISINSNQKNILLTAHRRENFGEPMQQIFTAVEQLCQLHPDWFFHFPVHPNPKVKQYAHDFFKNNAQVQLLSPLKYQDLLWLMNQCDLVLTDSGGIQEEAPSLGKPVLVLRNYTERTEGIDAGTAILVGTDTEKIIKEVEQLLENPTHYEKMAKAVNPYGDGKASEKIVTVLNNHLNLTHE